MLVTSCLRHQFSGVLKRKIADFIKLALFQQILLLAHNLPNATLLVFKQIWIIILFDRRNYLVIQSQFDLTCFCKTIK